MGYESKLYVIEKWNHTITNSEDINGKHMYYADLICLFDLSKCYPVSEKMRKYPATDCFIYADDGNTRIVEDRYGEPLREIPIKDAIKIIEKAQSEEYYRRYVPIIGALKALANDTEHWRELVVLHYGY